MRMTKMDGTEITTATATFLLVSSAVETLVHSRQGNTMDIHLRINKHHFV